MTERILLRGGKPCGIYFRLHGPRATQFSAIWETDRNQILFYGSGGERIERPNSWRHQPWSTRPRPDARDWGLGTRD